MIYKTGDYVIDQYGDVCLIVKTVDSNTIKYIISWVSKKQGGVLMSSVIESWAQGVKRMARPEEIMLAKLNGVTL